MSTVHGRTRMRQQLSEGRIRRVSRREQWKTRAKRRSVRLTGTPWRRFVSRTAAIVSVHRSGASWRAPEPRFGLAYAPAADVIEKPGFDIGRRLQWDATDIPPMCFT